MIFFLSLSLSLFAFMLSSWFCTPFVLLISGKWYLKKDRNRCGNLTGKMGNLMISYQGNFVIWREMLLFLKELLWHF